MPRCHLRSAAHAITPRKYPHSPHKPGLRANVPCHPTIDRTKSSSYPLIPICIQMKSAALTWWKLAAPQRSFATAASWCKSSNSRRCRWLLQRYLLIFKYACKMNLSAKRKPLCFMVAFFHENRIVWTGRIGTSDSSLWHSWKKRTDGKSMGTHLHRRYVFTLIDPVIAAHIPQSRRKNTEQRFSHYREQIIWPKFEQHQKASMDYVIYVYLLMGDLIRVVCMFFIMSQWIYVLF